MLVIVPLFIIILKGSLILKRLYGKNRNTLGVLCDLFGKFEEFDVYTVIWKIWKYDNFMV